MSYFSDAIRGERPRDRESIDESAWRGIRALIKARVEDGSFGAAFPETCHDGAGPIGTDVGSFWDAMQGNIPTLAGHPPWHSYSDQPSTLDALDIIEFCWRSLAKPIRLGYHDFFKHYHLGYDEVCTAGTKQATGASARC